MTGSPISATSLPTLKIGHWIEFISIDVIIVAKCASMLDVTHISRGSNLISMRNFFSKGSCRHPRATFYEALILWVCSCLLQMRRRVVHLLGRWFWQCRPGRPASSHSWSEEQPRQTSGNLDQRSGSSKEICTTRYHLGQSWRFQVDPWERGSNG